MGDMMSDMTAGTGLWMVLVTVTVIAVLVFAVLGGVWLWRELRESSRSAGRPRPGPAADPHDR